MPIPKEAGTLGMPWEQSYGYAHPDGPVLRERHQEGAAQYGATLDDVEEAYGGRPVVASTILVTPRLAFPSTVKMTGSFLSKTRRRSRLG